MRLFADTSILLAAAGSVAGSSHALFTLAPKQGWTLVGSPYVVEEAERNLDKLPPEATARWASLRPQLTLVDDVVTIDRPTLITASKDRPVLFTALAHADVLLTLDKADFATVLGSTFYGLPVLLPYDFLQRERDAGSLT